MAEVAAPSNAGSAPAHDPTATHKLIAQRIDQMNEDRYKKEEDKILYASDRKLEFKPEIKPSDKEWRTKRLYFADKLKKISVQSVLDSDFEEEQQLYLLPPMVDGEILRIQNEHAVDYNTALAEDGRFHGIPNNLATKLTMVHFGLHVASLTLNNIKNCSKDEDVDDPEDEPEELPSVQRIIYAEKPLEFLDEYNQRAQGYPILRSKGKAQAYLPLTTTKPKFTKAKPPVGASIHSQNGQANPPINPGPLKVGMRGGAGNPKDLPDSPVRHNQPRHVSVAPGSKPLIIYGYAGFLHLDKTQIQSSQDFLTVSLRLLGRAKDDQLGNFCVTMLSKKGDFVHESQNVTTADNFRLIFDSAIKPFLLNPDLAPWHIFVGPDKYIQPTSRQELTPPRNATDVFELTLRGVGTAYWKVPEDRDDKPAINQVQPGLFHALRFLFEEQPFGEITIDGHSIGYGGFEVTKDLLVLFQRSSARNKMNVTLKPGNAKLVYPRLIGSPGVISAASDDFEGLFDGISRAFDNRATGIVPNRITIWTQPGNRGELTDVGITIPNEKRNGANALRATFSSQQGLQLALFRPQWDSFRIKNIERESRTVNWQPRRGRESLESFREQLKRLFDPATFTDTTPFIITEEGATESRRFFITDNTTEEQWQRDVFDWFCTPNLLVRQGVENSYRKLKPTSSAADGVLLRPELRRQTAWGLFLSKNTIPARSSGEARGSSQNVPRQTSVSQPPVSQPLLTQLTRPTGFGNTALRPFNKARHEADKAGQAPAQTYPEWSTEQRYQDHLHYASYTKDQGVIIPGRTPAAPMYGESVQVQHKISDALPTVYMNPMTPTDVRLLQKDRQHYRNDSLQREHVCRVCALVFLDYKPEQVLEHYASHQERERFNGECLYCGDRRWGFMTIGERRRHFNQHINEQSGSKMKDFWALHHCPVCNENFEDMQPDDIVAHCINKHAPGSVKFCDKCGINERELTPVHRKHHEKTCRQVSDGPIGSRPPEFCIKCSKNIVGQTTVEEQLHSRDCKTTQDSFCQKCGLEMTAFTPKARIAHFAICRRPGGQKKTFCRKCAEKLHGLGIAELKNHEENCWKTSDLEPDHSSLRLAETRKEKERSAALTARTNSFEDSKRRKNEEFDKREKKLREREESLKQERERIAARISNMSAAQRGGLETTHDLGSCPLSGCSDPVGELDRSQLYKHLKMHATDLGAHNLQPSDNGVELLCPLRKYDGTVCNSLLDTSRSIDFGVHLVHGLTDAEQRSSEREAAKVASRATERLRGLKQDLETEVSRGKYILRSNTAHVSIGAQVSTERPSASGATMRSPVKQPVNKQSSPFKSTMVSATQTTGQHSKLPASSATSAQIPHPLLAVVPSTQKKTAKSTKLTEEEKQLKMSNPNEQADQGIFETGAVADDAGTAGTSKSTKRRRKNHADSLYHPSKHSESESLTDTGEETTASKDQSPALEHAPSPAPAKKRKQAPIGHNLGSTSTAPSATPSNKKQKLNVALAQPQLLKGSARAFSSPLSQSSMSEVSPPKADTTRRAGGAAGAV